MAKKINVICARQKKKTKSSDRAVDRRGRRKASLSIGAQSKRLRRKRGLTIGEVAKEAALSMGMLSKIENDAVSPSLSTIAALARALRTPITALFMESRGRNGARLVRAGQGSVVRGNDGRLSREIRLLACAIADKLVMEPRLITLTDKRSGYPSSRHKGVEFVYIIGGDVQYRYADTTYRLRKGDSLFIDATAPHGIEKSISGSNHILSVAMYNRSKS